jgi:hypothetical protein
MAKLTNLSKYNKFLIALVGALILGLSTYYGEEQPEWFVTVVGVLTSLGVYIVPNKK